MNELCKAAFGIISLLGASCCMAQAAESVELVFNQFNLAAERRDWPVLQGLVAPMREVEPNKYFQAYRAYLSGLPEVHSRESLKTVALVGERGPRTVFKISLLVDYYNPLAEPSEGQYEEVHYALSTNAGKRWWIDPAGCNTDEDAMSFLHAGADAEPSPPTP